MSKGHHPILRRLAASLGCCGPRARICGPVCREATAAPAASPQGGRRSLWRGGSRGRRVAALPSPRIGGQALLSWAQGQRVLGRNGVGGLVGRVGSAGISKGVVTATGPGFRSPCRRPAPSCGPSHLPYPRVCTGQCTGAGRGREAEGTGRWADESQAARRGPRVADGRNPTSPRAAGPHGGQVTAQRPVKQAGAEAGTLRAHVLAHTYTDPSDASNAPGPRPLQPGPGL